jgi:prevent-host-death family protein
MVRDVMSDPEPYRLAAVVPMGQARGRLPSLVDLARRTRDPVLLTRGGEPVVVLVDAQEWALVSRLADAMEAASAEVEAAEVTRGDTVPLAGVLAELAEDEAAEARRLAG